MTTIKREDVEFESNGETLRAWLYRPGNTPSACIVMAHGFGLTRDAGLEPFAQRLCDAGHAVVLFDYRHWGQSTGEPRHLLSFARQLEDWAAAIAFARRTVDAQHVVTWGTSLGAGHAVTAAARDRDVSGAIALNPMFSGLASTLAAMRGWGVFNTIRVAGLAIADLGSLLFGRTPRYLPTSAPSGSLGLLTQPDAFVGYQRIVSPDFDLRMAARIAFYFWSYRPGRHLRRFGRPLLSIVCLPDTINPAKPSLRFLARCEGASVVEIDCHHMEVYLEPHCEKIMNETQRFVAQHFGGVS